ncbi:MAG: CDP-diacylglycerol--glycerol-3-phosphate 3-phosphatidyltransferase [Pseudomonadota bacterium]
MRAIPNILSVFRLLAPILIMAIYLGMGRPFADWLAFWIFAFAAITDFLDGFLARRFNIQSALGRIVDPVADKVLVLATGTILIVGQASVTGLANPMVLVPFVLIIIREVSVSGLREVLAGRLVIPSTFLAKSKTALQLIAVGLMFFQPIFGFHISELTQGMDDLIFQGIMTGAIADEIGLRSTIAALRWLEVLIPVTMWIAAIVTWITGFDYFFKATKFLKGESAA